MPLKESARNPSYRFALPPSHVAPAIVHDLRRARYGLRRTAIRPNRLLPPKPTCLLHPCSWLSIDAAVLAPGDDTRGMAFHDAKDPLRPDRESDGPEVVSPGAPANRTSDISVIDWCFVTLLAEDRRAFPFDRDRRDRPVREEERSRRRSEMPSFDRRSGFRAWMRCRSVFSEGISRRTLRSVATGARLSIRTFDPAVVTSPRWLDRPSRVAESAGPTPCDACPGCHPPPSPRPHRTGHRPRERRRTRCFSGPRRHYRSLQLHSMHGHAHEPSTLFSARPSPLSALMKSRAVCRSPPRAPRGERRRLSEPWALACGRRREKRGAPVLRREQHG